MSALHTYDIDEQNARRAESGDLLYLSPGEDVPNIANAVIEIPYRGRNKIEYDKQLHIFRLDRVLHSSMYYPGDYGFIPRTLALDGDPLDVLVLVQEPTFSGCVVPVRPIGYLKMLDEGVPDEKIISVPIGEPSYAEVESFRQIPSHVLAKICHFFETYKLLEGKHTSSDGWRDVDEAKQLLNECAERFNESLERIEAP
jgi:inorganic pyrophosphatase